MSTKHTFLVLDILAKNPTMVQEFSPSSLNSSGLELLPRKKTRENTGNIPDGKKKKNLWTLKWLSLVDKRFWFLSLPLFASVLV